MVTSTQCTRDLLMLMLMPTMVDITMVPMDTTTIAIPTSMETSMVNILTTSWERDLLMLKLSMAPMAMVPPTLVDTEATPTTTLPTPMVTIPTTTNFGVKDNQKSTFNE